jgi:hypothetical protein
MLRETVMDSLDESLGQPLPTYHRAARLDCRSSILRRISRSKQFAANGGGASGSLSSRGVFGQVKKPEISGFGWLSLWIESELLRNLQFERYHYWGHVTYIRWEGLITMNRAMRGPQFLHFARQILSFNQIPKALIWEV